MKVVVYSHDADTRAEMKLAIGARPAPDAPEAEIIEVATAPALFRLLDARGVDVMVLDGEAQPAGGMGVSRQAKDEIYNCPPALLVIGRADDRWLATWSRAEATRRRRLKSIMTACSSFILRTCTIFPRIRPKQDIPSSLSSLAGAA